MSSAPVAVVFDHTALLALGAGSRLLSGLVSQAHGRPGRHIFAPGLCLTAAIAQRPGLADHIGALPTMQVIDLDYGAQAIDAGRPTAEWPRGRPVITTTPEPYADWGVEIIAAT